MHSFSVNSVRLKLDRALQPERLIISDDSALHAGHAGREGKGPEDVTHLTVTVVSARFAGMTRVARQRLVYGALQEELHAGLHALALHCRTPEEEAHE